MPTDMKDVHSLDDLLLADLEAIRLLLRGGSVIDWHRLNFENDEQVTRFIAAQEIDLSQKRDRQRVRLLQARAVSYLRRRFEFPMPKPVEHASVEELLMMASGSGHRQLCACTILKVMHVIHHAEARELLFQLPISNEQLFALVEQKVYRIIGEMLADGFPIVEFIGGRKNKDSLYTKLMSKPEVTAARIYDKVRFRLVCRDTDDLFPILQQLMSRVFPFNFVIPRESSNTLFHFGTYCEEHVELRDLYANLQIEGNIEDTARPPDNVFSAPSYRVVHFVVDMPICLPDHVLESATRDAGLGRIAFAQCEFQVIDQTADQQNEMGTASHSAYKARQLDAVMRRLKLGISGERKSNPPRKSEE